MHEAGTARHLRFIQLTQEFHVILGLLSAHPVLIFLSDPMLTSGSLLPMTCLISSPANLMLNSQGVVSSGPADEIDTQFKELFSTFAILIVLSRYPSSASCVVTATACSDGVVLGTPKNSGVRLCFRLHCLPSHQHHHQCHRCCLLESSPG